MVAALDRAVRHLPRSTDRRFGPLKLVSGHTDTTGLSAWSKRLQVRVSAAASINVSGHGAPQVARRPPIFGFDLARSLKMGVRRAHRRLRLAVGNRQGGASRS